ncbi:MAG: aspartate--tRNA(Asn) ligase [Candidatus Fermentibacteraceae bacterium]|nr:aspartate--tRNA(Asn) ligase [Candidatus Fermentibacteraceae bacterium]MBN2607530.1 aspartate--tRNA(Asn) ligase [Candidatus Fermentibacteraceae bacterium]
MKGITDRDVESPIAAVELERSAGETIVLHGVIQRIRRLGWGAFIILRRHDGLLQCVMGAEGNESVLDRLVVEQAVEVTGTVKNARIKDSSIHPRTVELQLDSVRVLNSPAEQSPVDMTKKVLDLHIDTNLDLRPLSLRHPVERARLKVAETLASAFRDSLSGMGFTEIHTPKICSAGAEGGANIFRVKYFDREAFLAQSPQFYKQMGVGIFERVFEIGPVFRAEPHQTSRHINEYTSLDLEMGFINGFHDVMAVEISVLRKCLSALREINGYELEMLEAVLPEIPESIPAITLAEAHRIFLDMTGEDCTGEPDLSPEEEKVLCARSMEEWGSEFLFVTHFPTEKRPFYTMDDPEEPGTTLSFDLLLRGLEVTTGGQRIHDWQAQVDKMRAFGLDPDSFQGYLQAHKYGLPPHGGLAIGLERLTARILDVENIRLTTMFPRDVKRLTP